MAAGISHALTTVGTSAAVVADPADTNPSTRCEVSVLNTHASNIVYLGGPGVTTSSYGWRLGPGQGRLFTLDTGQSLWAVASAAGTDVAVLYTPA